ncbi:unnamed protein product, partial [marine sediment metagenome]
HVSATTSNDYGKLSFVIHVRAGWKDDIIIRADDCGGRLEK